ncbi:CTD nuclear envelope phosphatase 1 homolog [Quercus lobata]|uniref:FCP1 homology domain-containing protein n=1 Tax=Quercus lobata TaxID=97700 RepID=A0A7N2M436_QUELO|nr:CTD nuclear envelope phosphatase 1 homolog [Quercus lobata]
MAQAEVYTRSWSWSRLQVWRAVVDWLEFLLQLITQILRGTPSFAHLLLSYLRLPISSHFLGSNSNSSSSSSSFTPLPLVELELEVSSQEEESSVSVDDTQNDAVDDDHRIEKLTVVLDMDETLVCAYEKSSLPASIHAQAMEAGLKWFEIQCVSSDKSSEGKQKINYVTVFERPGLQEFLDQISKFADLVLFTAGLEGYARPLVDKIDVENRFSLRLYRPSTVSTEYREHVKDLSCLSKDLSRIVIVDNNPFSFLKQPLNGIPCIPFSAGQPYDDQLLEVLLPLLQHLSMQKDVRPVLYEQFHMPEWFQMQGIPVCGLTE